MTPDINGLTFEQLRTLSREVASLIAQRRHEALERLREEASILGFTASELLPSTSAKKKTNGAPKYSDGNGNSWSGKGKKPKWLQAKIDEGHSPEDFAS